MEKGNTPALHEDGCGFRGSTCKSNHTNGEVSGAIADR